MKKSSIACGLLIASGSLFAQQYSISTIAGNGTAGWSGDLGPATSAQFHNPLRVVLDSAGNVYLNDFGNSSIREVYTDGSVNSVTGNGSPGYSGDGGTPIGAQLSSPHDIAIDSANNLYIADTGNYRIRLVSKGKISTFAGGTHGVQGGNLGDGGPATSASFILPTGVAVDKSGNVYISDIGNATVRKVSPNGVITPFAGTGFLSFGAYQGEGGPATKALLGMPYSLTTDSAGNVYIVDIGLSRLFRIGSDGIIHTVNANFPAQNCVVDDAGNVYAANYASNTVVKIVPGGTTLWIAGDGATGYAGDGGVGTSANMAEPYGVAIDKAGNVYVAEGLNAVIRKLTPVPNTIGAISNSATNQPFSPPASNAGDATVPIAPGEIVTLFGAGMGPATLVSNTPVNGVFPTSLSGTKVTIGGVDAPIIYTSSALVSAIVPYALNGLTSANVVVTYNGVQTTASSVPVAATAPGIFSLDSSGAGQALAVNLNNGALNSATNPVSIGGFVILYVTGEGQTTPGGVDGKLTPVPTTASPGLITPTNTVTATVNGIPATVTYAEAPGIVAGVLQVNLQIPVGVAPGAAQVKLFTTSLATPSLSIYVSQ